MVNGEYSSADENDWRELCELMAEIGRPSFMGKIVYFGFGIKSQVSWTRQDWINGYRLFDRAMRMIALNQGAGDKPPEPESTQEEPKVPDKSTLFVCYNKTHAYFARDKALLPKDCTVSTMRELTDEQAEVIMGAFKSSRWEVVRLPEESGNG
jgi:hypothetical protein